MAYINLFLQQHIQKEIVLSTHASSTTHDIQLWHKCLDHVNISMIYCMSKQYSQLDFQLNNNELLSLCLCEGCIKDKQYKSKKQ